MSVWNILNLRRSWLSWTILRKRQGGRKDRVWTLATPCWLKWKHGHLGAWNVMLCFMCWSVILCQHTPPALSLVIGHSTWGGYFTHCLPPDLYQTWCQMFEILKSVMFWFDGSGDVPPPIESRSRQNQGLTVFIWIVSRTPLTLGVKTTLNFRVGSIDMLLLEAPTADRVPL